MGDRADGSGARPAAPGLAAGAQGLADVQRRGLTAAGELVDRLIRAVDGDGGGGARGNGDGSGGDGHAGGRQTGGEGAAAPTGSAADLLELWLDVVRLGLDAFGQFLTPALAAPAGRDAGATVDVTTGASAGAVRLEVAHRARSSGAGGGGNGGEGDERAGTEVWLHNGGDHVHSGLVVHAGDLRASDGAVLPAEALRLAPSVVDLPGRSSRGVVMSVAADVPPGTYRGVLLVAGVPDAWLPIEVSVTGAPVEG